MYLQIGKALNLSNGIIRASHRDSLAESHPPELTRFTGIRWRFGPPVTCLRQDIKYGSKSPAATSHIMIAI